MPTICYQDKDFRPAALAIIERANAICAEYQAQGFDLTLRQLYYQFVARGIIANKDTEYKRLGGIINDARLAGLMDWDYIVDRTRNLRGVTTWDSPAQIIRAAWSSYREALWEDQDYHVEVWIEKDALVGVIEGVCQSEYVDYFSCRGYTSQSEMWAAGQRMAAYGRLDKQCVILHLGDHDPSGIDMTRDIQDRLDLFAGYGTVQVERIALTMDQVRQYQPPPNPAKITDSRAGDYIARYGQSSWELDALDPTTLADLIRRNVDSYRDQDRWDEAVEREAEQKARLKAVHRNWDAVGEYARRLEGER